MLTGTHRRQPILDPLNIDPKLSKLGIQSMYISSHHDFDKIKVQHDWIDWARHGICGRGVLLDLVEYFTESGTKELPYDPWTTHTITVDDLQACAQKQGVAFRVGDILIIRAGFIQKYNTVDNDARAALGAKEETLSVVPHPHSYDGNSMLEYLAPE